MPILGFNLYLAEGILAGCGAEKFDRLGDMLPHCDFVSLHCPGGVEMRHMIDAAQLGCMKPGAYLINTARGSIIDEAALVACPSS
jgi:phosphoglycerate dehydrogenase-like enzyme